MPTRSASATWEGGLKGGRGNFNGESGGIGGAYSFGSRFENGSGSNPEELLAAAEAACFSMALSGALEKNGTPARKVETRARCTVEKVGEGFQITRMVLDVEVDAHSINKGAFDQMVEATKTGCPVSRALAGVKIEVNAKLSS